MGRLYEVDTDAPLRLKIAFVALLVVVATGCGSDDDGSSPAATGARNSARVELPYNRYNFSWSGTDRSFVYKLWTRNDSGYGGQIECELYFDERSLSVSVLPTEIATATDPIIFVDGTLPTDLPGSKLNNHEPQCFLLRDHFPGSDSEK
jgi:hypothetical protein